ncbi:MAG TPA: DUF58 domain-containing protein [Symbiobacteriaceae bacterium]
MRSLRMIVLVAAALIFARMSGGRLPYFAFYLFGGLLLAALLWTRHALKRTECLIQVESVRSEVGQSLGVKVRIDNEAFLPLPWVEVDDRTPQHLVDTDMPRQATSVPLWGSRIVHFKLTAKRRGHYTVGPIRITMGDAFGLFQGWREYRSRTTITVYPRVHRLEGLPVPLSQPFGPVRTREKAFEDPSNQAEIRKYRPGDNPRYIHWKTTARMGELMLREYELNATTQMILFPDMFKAAQAGSAPLSTEETDVELAASLAELGLRRKVEVGLVAHAQERFAVAPARGQRTFHEILEVLSRVEAVGCLPLEQVLEREAAHLSGKTTLVVITPRLSARLADLLIRLHANHQVMLVLLRRESFIPAAAGAPRPADQGETEVLGASEMTPDALTGLLLMHHIAVYLVSAGDDLRRLAELRLSAGPEGVRAWSQGARPYATR